MENVRTLDRLETPSAAGMAAIEIDGGRIERNPFWGWQPLLRWSVGDGRVDFTVFYDRLGTPLYVDSIDEARTIVSEAVARLKSDEARGTYHDVHHYTDTANSAVGEVRQNGLERTVQPRFCSHRC